MPADVQFIFKMSPKDVENFIGLFDSMIAKCNQQIASETLAASRDPGYISQRHIYEGDKAYFTAMRSKVSASRRDPISETIADRLFEKTQMYDLLARKYFDIEIDHMCEVDIVQSGTSNAGETVYRFSDGSGLVVNSSEILYQGKWYPFTKIGINQL